MFVEVGCCCEAQHELSVVTQPKCTSLVTTHRLVRSGLLTIREQAWYPSLS